MQGPSHFLGSGFSFLFPEPLEVRIFLLFLLFLLIFLLFGLFCLLIWIYGWTCCRFGLYGFLRLGRGSTRVHSVIWNFRIGDLFLRSTFVFLLLLFLGRLYWLIFDRDFRDLVVIVGMATLLSCLEAAGGGSRVLAELPSAARPGKVVGRP